jgi:hypothetical protein
MVENTTNSAHHDASKCQGMQSNSSSDGSSRIGIQQQVATCTSFLNASYSPSFAADAAASMACTAWSLLPRLIGTPPKAVICQEK